ARDEKLAVVDVEMHVARTARHADVLHHAVRLRIDDDEVVGLLVAHEDEAGVLRARITRREREEQQDKKCRKSSHCRSSALRAQRPLVAGGERTLYDADGASWCGGREEIVTDERGPEGP